MTNRAKLLSRKSYQEIVRQLGDSIAVVLLMLAILNGGTGSQSAALPQGMNPQQVAASLQANGKALKSFSYQQRMQLQLKGETKKSTVSQVTHDPTGNEVKTQLSEEPPPNAQDSSAGGGVRGRLKHKVVEKKTGEFKQMMEDIAKLVKSYTQLPHEQMQAALQKANFAVGQGHMLGSVQIQMQNVHEQGDSMTIWIDHQTMLFRRVEIATTYENNPVTVTASYAMLPGGPAYMAHAVLNYPKKEVVVQIDNSNYQRS